MRIKTFHIALGMVLAGGALFSPAARAVELNDAIKVTFSAPVDIPGRELPPGTYIFEDMGKTDYPDMIRIYNVDRTVVATLLTRPVERRKVTEAAAVTLAEQSNGKPEVLVRWFYGDALTGHEFFYPKQEEREIMQAKQDTFVGNELMPTRQAAGE